MDKKLKEFENLWTDRFIGRRVPDLSSLTNSPLNLETIVEVLKDDKKTQTAQREQLKEVQYCLSYILKSELTFIEEAREETNPDSSYSLYDRFDPPKKPRNLSLASDNETRGSYENWKGAAGYPSASTRMYDTVPTPRPKVIHSEKFIVTINEVCELIRPNQGKVLLENLGVTHDGSIDLPKILLENKTIQECNLSPFFKALEGSQLAHLIPYFEKFERTESSDQGEDDDGPKEDYMEMKPIDKSTEEQEPPLPSSPRPDLPSTRFFSGEPEERGKDHYLAQNFRAGPGTGSLSMGRRGSLDPTQLGGNRGTFPRRGPRELTKSLESIKPSKLLSMVKSKQGVIRSASHKDSNSRCANIPPDASVSEDWGNRSHSPVSSPISPMGPKNGLQFVIRITEDCKPPKRAGYGLTGLEGYEPLLCSKGEHLDVIDLWSQEYIARNLKGEIGLVPFDKCEVLTGANPVLWGRDWFLKCARQHTGSDLLRTEPVGTFFVRDSNSKSGDLVLAVKLLTISAKFQITVKMARYDISSTPFASLDALIAHYHQNAIYIENDQKVFLTKPLRHERCM